MSHGAHKARRGTKRQSGIVASLFAPAKATHSLKAVRQAQAVATNGAMVGLAPEVVDKLNEIVPPTRRSIRLARESENRRHAAVVSVSLAALVGATATAVMSGNPSRPTFASGEETTTTSTLRPVGAASRSESRAPLQEPGVKSMSREGTWSLGSDNTSLDVSSMSKSIANNPQIAALMDQDYSILPAGFNPNHATGDSGNGYAFSQCTWWVYVRRHQLGLPAGSQMGNGGQWAASARALGYWVDNTARHAGDIMVFAPGQDGSSPTCGHVAIIEQVNPDGSVVTSECGVTFQGKTFSRTFTAAQVAAHQVIHY
ncbi:CHAP domain-containing protein [Bifidobacterium sp. ESL0775]|uniref:CHAP domain-containing protein n=1 Tax=Bifidobacterium sp. ESL0775 TaxID=2983230 RepID=UPI0023F63253|nr:CHAP domain-containing protein [Bifidobacterium sp. ESL0775]WEV68959.1 CHAP domain-containing protein [Bifidobacterium sp. ESL0775]